MVKLRGMARGAGSLLLLIGLLVPALVTRDAGADVGPSATTTTTVPYRCTGVGFASGLGTLDRSLTVTFTAPTEVTVGQAFNVTADVPPIQLAYPGFAVDLVGRMQFNPVGATGSNGGTGVSAAFNVSSDTFPVPQLRETLTPTVGAGGTITVTAGSLFLLVGATGFDCVRVAGSVPGDDLDPGRDRTHDDHRADDIDHDLSADDHARRPRPRRPRPRRRRRPRRRPARLRPFHRRRCRPHHAVEDRVVLL